MHDTVRHFMESCSMHLGSSGFIFIHNIVHQWDRLGDSLEVSICSFTDLFQSNPRSNFNQREACTTLLITVKYTHVCNDAIHNFVSRQRQRTCLQHLGRSILGRVVHCDHNTRARSTDEVHCTAHTLDEFSWNDPIGQVTFGTALETAQDGQIDVTSANHVEGVARREGGCAWHGCDSFLSGVDVVGVGNFLVFWVGANAHESILGLEFDLDALRDVVGGHGWNTNSQVNVHTVLELLGSSTHDPSSTSLDNPSLLVAAQTEPFDGLVVVDSLDDVRHVDAWQMNLIGVQFTRFYNLFCFCQHHLSRHATIRVGILCRSSKDQVTTCIGLPSLYESNITLERSFHDILSSIKLLYHTGFTLHFRCAATIGFVLDGDTTIGIDGTSPRWRKESRHTSSGRLHSLC
mmetsp:Transcript_48259/g.71944  ORF Transcript_48259/g.71944 Transcript_48259/m.71944 type:complete len:404 (+) Transcript_48259:227-1438(+)